ncbi:MAG: CpsD/CapB family tyrosine-protein kinase [Ruminococcaceae bacterium]|nr:CpsD/CapB family tyrosine-protein kinase [Oscillospiraceae bacterium]
MTNNENLENISTEDVYSNTVSNKDRTSVGKKVTFNTASVKDYATSEAYKTFRTNLFFCGNDIKTIVITSCREGEGKSTVSTELAKSLAENGKRTLLIDADMRKSVMLKKRNVYAGEVLGLSEILSGICNVNEALYNTQLEGFDVIFSGPFPPNPVELMASNLSKLLESLKESYDYIIIDSPPLGQVIDAAVIATCCDAAIMVISNKKTNRRVAINVKNQLQKSGCRILGAVLNEIEKGASYNRNKYYGKYMYKY